MFVRCNSQKPLFMESESTDFPESLIQVWTDYLVRFKMFPTVTKTFKIILKQPATPDKIFGTKCEAI